LDDRFDNVVCRRERIERRGGGQPAQRRVAISGVQLALLDELAEGLLDAGARPVQRRRRHILQGHGEPGLREHLGDPGSHGARADDGYVARRHRRNITLKLDWVLWAPWDRVLAVRTNRV